MQLCNKETTKNPIGTDVSLKKKEADFGIATTREGPLHAEACIYKETNTTEKQRFPQAPPAHGNTLGQSLWRQKNKDKTPQM